MANEFYNPSGFPFPNEPGDSASARGEFTSIGTGFNKMPAIAGHGLQMVRVNAPATGLESVDPGSMIDAATAKTVPADADEIPLADSAASFVLKKITWANIKAAMHTYLAALTDTWAISTTGNSATSTAVTTTLNNGVVATTQTAGDNTTKVATDAFVQSAVQASSPVVGTIRNAKMSVTVAGATGTFTADEVIVESALGGTGFKLASYSQAINLATTGAGGMDTGSAPASGYVALYAIAKAGGTSPSILACNASTSNGSVYSGVNMPATYTMSALIGMWPTNGSSQFVPGFINSNKFSWQAWPAIFTAHAQFGSATSQSISAGVPPNAKSVSLYFGSTTVGPAGIGVAAYGDASGTGGVNAPIYLAGGSSGLPPGNLTGAAHLKDVQIITAQTIYVLGGAAASTNNLYVSDFTW